MLKPYFFSSLLIAKPLKSQQAATNDGSYHLVLSAEVEHRTGKCNKDVVEEIPHYFVISGSPFSCPESSLHYRLHLWNSEACCYPAHFVIAYLILG